MDLNITNKGHATLKKMKATDPDGFYSIFDGAHLFPIAFIACATSLFWLHYSAK